MSSILPKIPIPRGKNDGNASKHQPFYHTAPKSRRPLAFRDYILKSLPPSSGPYDVGSIDLEIPVEKVDFGIKRDGKSVLVMETVLFTILYPIKLGTNRMRAPDGRKRWSRQLWLSKDRNKMGRGYGDFSGVNEAWCQFFFNASVGLTKLPAWRNAPIAEHFPAEGNVREKGAEIRDQSADDPLDRPPRFPIVLFTHGLGGTRTTYSALCSEYASYGFTCVAIEHRDGSGPRTFVNYEDGTEARVVDYIRPEDGRTDTSNEEETDHELRNAQLRMRKREIHETWKILCQINSGNGAKVAIQNRRIKPLTNAIGGTSRGTKGIQWDKWQDRLQVDNCIMCGHSFGGATTVSVLRTPEMLKYIKYGIVLDIWGQGLPLSPLEDEQEHVSTPILAMGSESFLYWEENLKIMFDLARDTRNNGQQIWMLTIRGSFHLSFSDFSILWPRIFKVLFKTKIQPQRGIDIMINASMEYFKHVMPDRVNRWNRGTDEKLLDTPISDGWRNVEGKRNDWKRKMKRHGGDDREIWMHIRPDSGLEGIEGHTEGGTDSKAGEKHVSTAAGNHNEEENKRFAEDARRNESL